MLDLRIGELVDGTFRVLERIGAGGMGVVYRARDEHLQREMALKFLSEAAVDDEDQRRRFRREARALSAVDHPNICTIHRIGFLDDGDLYLCMALVEGGSLADRLREGPLQRPEAVDAGIQVCRGLEAAHELSIVHRDIKPGNLLVGSGGRVQIVDFGLAKRRDEEDLTSTGSSYGTLAYMSPEQARGQSVDARTDLWSLGVVLYEAIVGRRPFPGPTLPDLLRQSMIEEHRPVGALVPGVPQDLSDLVDELLAKDARARPAAAAEVRRRLEAIEQRWREVEVASTEAVSRVTAASPSAPLGSSTSSDPKAPPTPDAGPPSAAPGVVRRLVAVAVVVAVVSALVLLRSGSFGSGSAVEDQERALRAAELLARATPAPGVEPPLQQDRIALLEQAWKLDPTSERIRLELAETHLKHWELEALEPSLGRAEELLGPPDPVESAHAARVRARLARHRGRADEAIEALRVHYAESPGDELLLDELVKCQLAAGRTGEAERLLRRTVEQTPRSWVAWFHLGKILQEGGAFEEATHAYREADGLAPASETLPVEALAALLLTRGEYEEAAEAYERLPPEKATVAGNLSTAYFFLGRIDDAIEWAEMATRLGPDEPLWSANLADCYLEAGRTDAARRAWARAAELRDRASGPDASLGDRLTTAYYYAKAGECPPALAGLDEAPPRQTGRSLHFEATVLALCGQETRAVDAALDSLDAGYSPARFREPDLEALLADPRLRAALEPP